MIRRSTWIALALFAAVLAFAWGFRRYQDQKAASVTPTLAAGNEKLLDVDESELASLRVEDDQGKFLVLGRNLEGMWIILEPQGGGETDTAAAESAITQLLALRAQFTLEMPDDLEKFGLATPQYTITVSSNGGEKHEIQVGSEAPAVSGYYVRLDGGAPQVVSKFSVDPILNMVAHPPYAPTATPTIPAEAGGTPGAPEASPAGTPTVQP